MTKVQKITLSPSRDIPFNKLVLSQSNVRRVKAGVSIEQLAESIAQRTLLQSLNVRAVLDGEGNETGMFEVPAGASYNHAALFIAGERSDYVLPEFEPDIRRLFPAAQIVRIPDAGHWLHAEQPQAFLDIVIPFLARR